MIRVRTQDADLTDAVNGLRYSNVDPGGHESASFDVPAQLAPNRGDSLFIEDKHGMIWQGRVDENDLSVGESGDRRLVTAYGEGILLKRQSLAMDFVQSSVAAWTGPSVAERAAAAATYALEAGSVEGGGIITKLPQPDWNTADLPLVEMWYRSPGPIGRIQGQWTKTAGVSAGPDNYIWYAYLVTTDVLSVFDDTGDMQAAGPATFGLDSTANNRTYAALRFGFNAAVAGSDSLDRTITWDQLKIFGNHDLTVRGTGEDAGLYGGDIINYLLGLVDGVDARAIDAPTDWIISHLAMGQRVSIEDFIYEVNKQFGYSWGTWDSGTLFDTTPRFDWKARDTEAKWTIRRSQADISLAATLAEMANTIYVRYVDPSGQPQELTDTAVVRALADAGIDQEGFVDAGLQVDAGAQRYADIFFSLQGQDPPLTGTIDIEGDVSLSAGGSLPAHHIRADGSLIRVEDLLPISEVYDLADLRQTLLPIKRVEVDASGPTPQTSISVDQTQDAISVLQARMAAEDLAQNF